MRLAPVGRVAAVLLLVACSSTSNVPVLDPTTPEFSFVVIGCNRVDAADTTGNASTANVQQLQRTFTEIAALKPAPKYVFFAGDLVLGYTNDTTLLARELNAWVALYKASPLATSGIELVALPGNHEVQNASKVAYAAGERTWLRIMAPYITHAGNGPGIGGADNLTTNQDSLTYSFDYVDSHFVTLNTDPVGNDWHVPYKWVATDLAAAKAAGKKHLFLIGHKPAFPYVTIPTDGLGKFPAARDSFWTVVTANKAEGMFSAHNHLYYRSQPAGGTSWQVIAGNGGSSLEATADTTIKPTGTYYGFTVTTVAVGGQVYTKSYGRNLPSTGGYTAVDANPTTVRDSVNLTQN